MVITFYSSNSLPRIVHL